jgi:acyl-coenzyme A thioesterase PaaI-like protein
MNPLPHTHSCFVCGDRNPLGLHLRFESDGEIVQASFIPKPEHIGFHQTVHGGLIATVLDEVMVWAAAVITRQFSFCAEFNIRYLKPLQPGRETRIIGRLTANRRNKIFETSGEVRDLATGEIFAKSTGKYIPVPNDQLKSMVPDFVSAPGWSF